ncbi:reverse transcriptase (RNA-dependent DNA polymerase) domain-containing protein [Trichoderma breve]|uniref:Reverse transcriptase (RNA-dependent DNA polymerase) domain-containing protein n=1 Tax=Trichoderma breve TaxID=2034170 RepID=A0A9W9EED5_9HYPO|nr:reverse transcriptase (RNA-dependent DNA polymerase) domain-containing protein [Trichoderma breve]KAJ4865181.1 reverse transcriptase (RNA-dependent DNA polymerase) domain-containing protein [Trichoderma breve]
MGPEEARRAYEQSFPHGHELIETSGENLLCGVRAVSLSFQNQISQTQTPTPGQLMDLLENEEIRMFEQETGALARDNQNNFFIDQLGAALHLWGQQQESVMHIQLGYVLSNGATYLVPTPEHPENVVIWIHSSMVEGENENTLQHYSGMRPRQANERVAREDQDDQTGAAENSTSSSDDEPTRKRMRQNRRVDIDILDFAEADSMRTRTAVNAFVAMAMVAPDMDDVEPTNYGQAMKTSEAPMWQEAVDNELQSLIQNETYEVIGQKDLPKGKKTITGRWVFKRKVLYDNEKRQYFNKYKARLVAKGFQQQEGIDYEEIFATVVKSSSYKVLLAIAAKLGLTVYLMDVKTAFLHGTLDVEVYMKPPPGMNIKKGKILRLKKALYGLKQAPRLWYIRLTEHLFKLGFRISNFDPCVFVHQKELLIVAVWVDDLLILAKEEETAQVFRQEMSKEFDMKDEGVCTYYLGMNIEQSRDGIHINQRRYAEQVLKRFGLEEITPAKTPMAANTILRRERDHVAAADLKNRYQSMVGSLMWLSNMTRPEMAYATNYCARFTANPNQQHMDATLHVMAYLAETLDSGLFYPRGTNVNIVGYSDADFAGCQDTRRSTSGYIFLLGGCPVSWTSQRQKSMATATMDAEYMAASDACKEAVWMRQFVNDLRVLPFIDHIPLYIDNNAALKLTKNPVLHKKAKHIDVRFHYIRERVMKKGDVKTRRVNTHENVADILTKALPRLKHEGFMEKLGMEAWINKKKNTGKGN